MTARRVLGALLTLMLVFLVSPGIPVAIAQEEAAAVSASMNSYYYIPGDQAYLDVRLELPGAVRAANINLELLVYPSATTRSSLASFREGTRRYPILRRTLETISPEAEWTDKMYEIDLKALGLQAGVYPFEARLMRGGEATAVDNNFLVILDPALGYPLNLAMLWTLDFLPRSNAQGGDLDGGLAAACSSSTSETGFLYALARAMKKTPEVRSSIVLPRTTYRDLEALAKEAGEGESGDSEKGAAEIISAFDGMSVSGQLGLLGTTYAFADPDILASQGWEADASEQVALGLKEARESGLEVKGFVAPLFRLSDTMLQRMVDSGVEFSVVGAEALESSAAGRRLLEGATISQPVRFVNDNGFLLKAFVRDEILYAYLDGVPERDAVHMVQNIFAELAVLQRERPYAVRSCVLAFPPGFMPSQDFLDELYGAVKSCPWLQARTLSELNADQFPLEGVALQAPIYPETPSSYMQKLGAMREKVEDFTAAIPAGHSLHQELRRSILTAENYRFTWDIDSAAALAFLGSIESLINGETSRVKIEQKRSVTLSSTEGKLSVDVTSTLDYPLENVTLRMENASLTFPGGSSREVTIEPRENRLSSTSTRTARGLS
jgi:hypothetical protein